LPLSEQWIVTNAEGDSLDYREGKKFPAQPQYALCRCGDSANKPFCDGSHKKVQFDGTETASREPHLEQAETIEGPTIVCGLAKATRDEKSRLGLHPCRVLWTHCSCSKRIAVSRFSDMNSTLRSRIGMRSMALLLVGFVLSSRLALGANVELELAL
jgi:CDGSH-type Zn-finger protein